MVRVFFSYSHKDEQLRDELEIHLTALQRQGLVEFWHDRRIGAGGDFAVEIDEAIETANVILLLVSPDFIASDYCYSRETVLALERHERGEARVIPVILRPCLWQGLPFGKLVATPKDGRPVAKFPSLDDGFLEVTEAIRRAATDLGARSKTSSERRAERMVEPDGQATARALPRSGNMRVKRSFSDRDKDRFLVETFEYVANFFEGSLQELGARHSSMQTEYRRVDGSRFYAAIYADGRRVSDCTIWRSGRSAGGMTGIAYTTGETAGSNVYSDCLATTDNGYALLLRATMSGLSGRPERENLTAEGAAEYYWSRLIGDLQ